MLRKSPKRTEALSYTLANMTSWARWSTWSLAPDTEGRLVQRSAGRKRTPMTWCDAGSLGGYRGKVNTGIVGSLNNACLLISHVTSGKLFIIVASSIQWKILIVLTWWVFFFNYYYYFFFTLKYCIGFTIHQHASAMGVHVFPILNPLWWGFMGIK